MNVMRPVVALLILISASSVGQERQAPRSEQQGAEDNEAIHGLFLTVEKAIVSGELKAFAPLFGKQVSMTIRGNESGYFSAAQALTILKNYFSSRTVLQFSFSRRQATATHPYATGRLDYTVRGSRESVQVYLSLTRQGSSWVISQFNIY